MTFGSKTIKKKLVSQFVKEGGNAHTCRVALLSGSAGRRSPEAAKTPQNCSNFFNKFQQFSMVPNVRRPLKLQQFYPPISLLVMITGIIWLTERRRKNIDNSLKTNRRGTIIPILSPDGVVNPFLCFESIGCHAELLWGFSKWIGPKEKRPKSCGFCWVMDCWLLL